MKNERERAERLTVALELIATIRRALADGIVHRNRAGQMLATETEVLQCMLDEGQVTLEEPHESR